MMKYFFTWIFFGSIIFLANSQQLDFKRLKNDSLPLPNKVLYLGFTDLAFIKNNEYFNFIADGYTLLGNQLDVDLRYRPQPAYEINVGASFQKYFGLSTFEKPIPYIGLKIDKGNSRFYIGKLDTDDNHGLFDPVYDFERHLDQRHIENGLQHRYKNKHWQTDTWLEWEHFIFKADTLRERLNFGQTTTYTYKSGGWEYQIPLQIYLMHRGGQINLRKPDNHKNNAMVIANLATGLSVSKHWSTEFSTGVAFRYFSHSINSDNTEEFIFKNGNAMQFLFNIRYKNWKTSWSYWQADHFVAPKGNDMYQTVSRRVDKYFDEQGNPVGIFKSYTEPYRKLLTGHISYQKEIIKDLHLGFIVDVYYQLNDAEIQSNYYNSSLNGQLDYATGLYLVYHFNFPLVRGH